MTEDWVIVIVIAVMVLLPMYVVLLSASVAIGKAVVFKALVQRVLDRSRRAGPPAHGNSHGGRTNGD